MNKKGIELASLTYIILGLVFLFVAYQFSDSIRGVLAPLIDSFGNLAGQSADDKTASSSVQALACAVDVTAAYGIVGPPGGVVAFSKFDSCFEKGDLKAPAIAPQDSAIPAETTNPTDTNTNGNSNSQSGNTNTLSGTKVSCGGADYSLSATNIDRSKNSADISIDFQGGTKATKTLTKANSCAVRASCLESSDYSAAPPYSGIQVRIDDVLQDVNGKKVNLAASCPAEYVAGQETHIKQVSITGKLVLSGSQYSTDFSTAVIDVTKSFGDKITGKAVDEPNKKCFGSKKDRCVVCGKNSNGMFSCTVEAFELPQKVSGSFTAYALAWVGIVGEPYYLAYYETFPPEAAAAWSYNTFDIAMTAVAIGAITNICGVGKIGKAVWAGAKTVEAASVKTMVVSIFRGDLRTAFKEATESKAATAFNEQLALEYGGKRALQHVIAAESTSAIIGGETLQGIGDIAVKESIRSMMIDKAGRIGEKIFRYKDLSDHKYWAETTILDDFNGLITTSKDITESDIDDIISQLEKTSAENTQLVKDPELLNTLKQNKPQLVNELKDLQKSYADDTLLTPEGRDALEKNLGKFMTDDAETEVVLTSGDFTLRSNALKKYATKTAMAAFGEKTGKYALKKDLPPAVAAEVQKNADEVAEMTYVRLLGTIDRMPGVDDKMKQRIIDNYISSLSADGVDQALVKESLDDATRILPHADEVYSAIKPTWKKLTLTEKSKNMLMGFSIGAAYVGMSQHALDKYTTTCGAGSLCLHTPSILERTTGDPRNYNDYGANNNLPFTLNGNQESYDGLVMLKLPEKFGTKATMRFNLASPCKTDLKVYVDPKKTNCVNYAGKDRVVLEAQTGGSCYDTNSGKPILGGLQHGAKDVNSCCQGQVFRDTPLTLVGIAIENPIKSKRVVVNKADVETKTKELLNEEYTGCPNNPTGRKLYLTINEVNIRQNVTTTNDELITNCEQPFGVDISGDSKGHNYIAIEPDTDSMKKYSDAGFGNNYCFENPTTYASYTKDIGCTAATLAVTAAAGGAITASGGTLILATPAITAAIGGGGAICEEALDKKARWPNSQY
ncbi:Uncharacterised protein [uncultured archaeon]|nr:Uncharacterised protein [uncultured archaeon]